MDLIESLRTTGAVREFRSDPINDALLYRLIETARFAPSGGNRQGWQVIVVKDLTLRRSLRDLYLTGWYEYLAQAKVGLVPWAPINDRLAEAEAIAQSSTFAQGPPGGMSPGFAEALDTSPALLLVLGDLTTFAAVDRDHDRYSFVGGASIYPFIWSVLLAARAEGIGGVMTTMVVRRENDVRALFGIPDTCAVAALVALGYPQQPLRRLRRQPVESFSWIDRYQGVSLDGS